jgi:hypothetical protein
VLVASKSVVKRILAALGAPATDKKAEPAA